MFPVTPRVPKKMCGSCQTKWNLSGGFNYFLFSPLFGEDEPNLTNIFQMG